MKNKFSKGTLIFITDKNGINTECDLDKDRELETGDVFTWNFNSIFKVTDTNPVSINCDDITED